MRFLILLITRVVILAISFAVSSLVAALFVTFALFLGGDAGWLKDDPLVAGGSVLFAGAAWLQIATLSFAPALLLFLGLELGRFSSLVVNLIAGGACGGVVLLMQTSQKYAQQELPYEAQEIWLAVLAAGFVAGFSHWLLAGHRAGRWMGLRENEKLSGSQ